MRATNTLALIYLLSASAFAGGITVAPQRLSIPANSRAGAVDVRNDDSVAHVLQADLRAWTQSGGQDRYTPTSAALATPALFRLQPGETQVVRVGLLGKWAPRQTEQAYRLFLSEVPTADTPLPDASGLRLLLRISMPVFALPQSVDVSPVWQARRTGDLLLLTLNNDGNAHLLIDHLRIENERGQIVAAGSGLWYVLAKARRSWRFKPENPFPSGRLHVRADTGTATLTADVAASPP